MTKPEFLVFHRAMCDEMIATTQRKNSDYSGADPSPFHNFTIAEKLGICSVEQGFLVRMSDKVARVISFMQKGELLVKDESVHDSLLDLANYCLLMSGYLKSKQIKEST